YRASNLEHRYLTEISYDTYELYDSNQRETNHYHPYNNEDFTPFDRKVNPDTSESDSNSTNSYSAYHSQEDDFDI
ncbi:MAG TPA: hypothetical protein VGE97_09235, partial [Nitrososphaera sp.]